MLKTEEVQIKWEMLPLAIPLLYIHTMPELYLLSLNINLVQKKQTKNRVKIC